MVRPLVHFLDPWKRLARFPSAARQHVYRLLSRFLPTPFAQSASQAAVPLRLSSSRWWVVFFFFFLEPFLIKPPHQFWLVVLFPINQFFSSLFFLIDRFLAAGNAWDRVLAVGSLVDVFRVPVSCPCFQNFFSLISNASF